MEPEEVESSRLRQIGPYRLLKKLGQGGMSSVFLATDEEGQQLALKLLHFSLELEPEFRRRFQREAELTQSLDHPHIVKTLAWADNPDIGAYLVMEYLPGGNLRQMLEEGGPWSLERTLKTFQPLAQALDYAHSQGVIHRDLKPENLLFGPQGLKIADFGVARLEAGTRITRTGVLPGTPEYMAPEQFSEQPSGPASDLYSLATILYEVLTGTTPFRSENLALVLQRQAFEAPAPPSQKQPQLPAYIDRVLLKSLEKDPLARHDSAAHLLEALAGHSPRAQGSLGELPTRQITLDRPKTDARKSLPWIWVWLIWTGAGMAWLWKMHPEPTPPTWWKIALGAQPAPLRRQLCASVLWNGFEVALVAPNRQGPALEQARFSSGQLGQWLQSNSRAKLEGRLENDEYLIEVDQQTWLRVDSQMSLNLGATPEQIGSYWVALLRDQQALLLGEEPQAVRELERKRPLRVDLSPPRYLLLQQLYERCRIRQRQGPLTPEILQESLQSLGLKDAQKLRRAARLIPLPKP